MVGLLHGLWVVVEVGLCCGLWVTVVVVLYHGSWDTQRERERERERERGVTLNGGVYLLINTFFFVLPRP